MKKRFKSPNCKGIHSDRSQPFVKNGSFVEIETTFFVLFRWLYPEWICLSNYAFKIIRFSTHYNSVVDELWTTKETPDMVCWLPKDFGNVHYCTVQRIWTVIKVWHSQFEPTKICKFGKVNVDFSVMNMKKLNIYIWSM